MNPDEDDPIDMDHSKLHQSTTERLLGQMSLESPSPSLDDSIALLLKTSEAVPSDSMPVSQSGFGWTSMICTALAAGIIGVIVGQLTPLMAIRSGDSVAASRSELSQGKLKHSKRSRPRIVEKGFELVDGEMPSRIYQIETGQSVDRPGSLPLRKRVVVPSPEI